MLYVKIMSDQDLPDTDPWHTYTIVTVGNNQTMKFISNPVLEGQIGGTPGERYSLEIRECSDFVSHHYLTGNAYVMNEAGKSIASHGC